MQKLIVAPQSLDVKAFEAALGVFQHLKPLTVAPQPFFLNR